MSDWISCEDRLPEARQPITARIIYQGETQEVKGCRSPTEPTIVLFDFYSGTGGERITEWKPRELPMKPDAHPWTGIENEGLHCIEDEEKDDDSE